jgi:hypothetical protein
VHGPALSRLDIAAKCFVRCMFMHVHGCGVHHDLPKVHHVNSWQDVARGAGARPDADRTRLRSVRVECRQRVERLGSLGNRIAPDRPRRAVRAASRRARRIADDGSPPEIGQPL